MTGPGFITDDWFLKGTLIGFLIAAALGPIGVLCIHRSLTQGFWVGFLTGLGAATADAAYAATAGFGLTAVSNFLINYRFWLGLVGGVFLCWLGLRTFRSRPPALASSAPPTRQGLLAAWFSTFLLTLANPMTILSFIAVFAGAGLAASPDYLSALSLVAGVFAGSGLWWLLLSATVGFLQSRLNVARLRALNYFSGALIFGFGVYALVRLRMD